eukprot:1191987-Prorocentrum_minimum.AAC.1
MGMLHTSQSTTYAMTTLHTLFSVQYEALFCTDMNAVLVKQEVSVTPCSFGHVNWGNNCFRNLRICNVTLRTLSTYISTSILSFAPPNGDSTPLDCERFNHSGSRAIPSPIPPTEEEKRIAMVMKLPLGLKLRKSESFIDLIMLTNSSEASQSPRSVSGTSAGSHPSGQSTAACAQSQNSTANVSIAGSKAQDSSGDSSTSNSEVDMKKLKASNFPVMHLRVGDWEYHSRFVGDLVSKCYFAKRKLVWEILHNHYKSKIEMQWSDICGLK